MEWRGVKGLQSQPNYANRSHLKNLKNFKESNLNRESSKPSKKLTNVVLNDSRVRYKRRHFKVLNTINVRIN